MLQIRQQRRIVTNFLRALDDRLIDDWRHLALRFWSVRLAVLWGSVSGVAAVWPAFLGIIPLAPFAILSVLMCVALSVARLTKQPGA